MSSAVFGLRSLDSADEEEGFFKKLGLGFETPAPPLFLRPIFSKICCFLS